MRHNGKPPLLASALPPNRLNLRPGERRQAVCPVCDRLRVLRKQSGRAGGWMIPAHRAVARSEAERIDFALREALGMELPRCSGAGQRIELDLTPAQWLDRLEVAYRACRPIRSVRPMPRPGAAKIAWPAAGRPPVPPPVFRIRPDAA